MTVSKLATALTIIFAVSVMFLAVELLFILRRRRSSSGNHLPPSNYSPKQLLFNLFCLKSQTRVEPSGAPTENPNGRYESSPEDSVIDVFKLLEANGPSRILCTIKEEESEYVESTVSGVDSGEVSPETEKVSLKEFLESEAAAEKADVAVDSPVFYTPVGSPGRDGF